MHDLFSNCTSLPSIGVYHWDTSHINNMAAIFQLCGSLTLVDVSHWVTSQATTFNGMFIKCPITTVDASGWDTSNVTEMQYMFGYCPNLTTLDLTNWNTSHVTNMLQMFNNCDELETLDLSTWDTSAVTNMTNMLTAPKLKNISFDPSWHLAPSNVLLDAPNNATYLGQWQQVGTGTPNNPKGPQYTHASLESTYSGPTIHGTYI